MTLVNGRRANLSNFRKFNETKRKNSIEVFMQSLEKENRLNYFNVCSDFYAQLKDMCEKLRNFPRKPTEKNSLCRQSVLKNYLYTFNQLLFTQRKEFSELEKR